MWLTLILLVSAVWAQAPDRVTAAIDSSQFVTLNGGVSPRVRSSVDQGSVDPLFKLGSIRMTFRQTPEQQAALKQLLAAQQDPSSPNYHQWLTPEQFGDRFGLNQSDIARISRWLESEGFSIVEVARGRNWISFSGTAGQVQHTFHTQIHHVTREGEEFFANVTEPSVPVALQGVVSGFLGLDNFKSKSAIVKPKSRPAYTDGSGNNELSPDDIATIYDLTPLYKAGIDGTGQKIAIMGQTDVHMSDIEQFRSGFGLSKNDPTVVLGKGCADPGYQPDEGEADLDLEWSGAVARNASIIFVTCDNNNNGVLGSLAHTINNNVAPVISMSYGLCEADFGAQNETLYQSWIQQANAQGQTMMVSTGDSGSATCDGHASIAVKGLSINGEASPPEVTAVGGTEFDGDVNNQSQYWDSTNGSTLSSAKSYIPELAWDDSAGGTDLQDRTLAGSGGGASISFKKPAFQTGPGVPSDGARDIPDVSMPASVAHDGYIYCTNADTNGGYQGSCASGIDTAVAKNSVVGGTSVASPVFAGIVALLNQSLGNAPPKGLGNINPTLYAYAQSTPSAFHDVPAGNYAASFSANPSGNVVPCQVSTPDCTNGTMGFLTTANYDLATGLGSVDGNVFVTHWPAAASTKTATNTTAEVNPSSINAGSTAAVTVSATVVPATGSGTPTGSVSFFNGTTQIGQAETLSGGKASVTYDTSKLPAGSDSITAVYSGDANFATSNSPAVTLTVGKGSPSLASTTTTLAITATPSSSQSDVGSSVTFTAVVTPGSGSIPPTGTVTFSNGSTALGTGTLANGTATFTTSTLPANQYSVTAVYGGDSNFNGSTSNASSLDVVDFQIAANPATITVTSPGQSGNAVLTISPMAGFSQSVSFACSGLPTGATCSFASASNGTTVTIATTAPISVPLSQRASVNRGGTLLALLLPGLFGLVFSGTHKRALSAMRVLMVLGAFALTSLLVACGGLGGGGGGIGSGGLGGTPSGTSNVTITATAGQLSHRTTIQLVVQ